MLQKLLFRAIRASAGISAAEPINLPTVRHVVAVELSRLGDVVETLPVIQHLRRHLPSAAFHCVVRKENAPLVQLCDIDVETHAVGGVGAAGVGYAVREIRTLRPDLAVSMSPSRSNALVALLSGARGKVGFLQYADSMTPFLGWNPVEVFGSRTDHVAGYGRENISRRSEKILLALGISPSGKLVPVMLRKTRAEEIRLQLMGQGKLPPGKYVLLHPFSAWEYRSWPPDNFAQLAHRIQKNLGMNVLAVCERRDLDRLKGAFEGQSAGVHLAGIDSTAELAVMIGNASLYVGNDSGPLHLAAMMGIPAVGIFGPAPPELTGPPNDAARYIYRQVACSPCDQKECVRPHDPCMYQYGVDEVFAGIREVFELSVTRDAAPHV